MALAFVLWYNVLVYFASIVSSTQAIECQGTARYTLTFQAEWTSQSHQDFPSSPHFSSLVGCSHKADYVMWTPGIKATTGVKNVAEFGSSSALLGEMDNKITLKKAYIRYIRGGISNTGRRDVDDIEVNSEYPLVSFITMIAPSPDWFVGVHDYNLCNTTTGKWLDSRTRDLPPYDAGTDSGPRFGSPNQITNPKENIHLLTNNTEGSFKGDKPVNRFGTFTFVKTYDSNPIIKPSSTIQRSQPSSSVNIKSIITDPKAGKGNSTPLPTMQQIQPSASVNAESSTIILDPKGSSTPLPTMQQIQPSASVNAESSTIILDPKGSSTPLPTIQRSQPSASVNAERSTMMIGRKESSTQQVELKITPSTKANVPTQTLTRTTTITVSASVTPTLTTTSAAGSVKQFGFIHVIFATILVHFCL